MSGCEEKKSSAPIAPIAEIPKDEMPTSRAFYEEMLDYFCNLYYDEAFGFQYESGSLVIAEIRFEGDSQAVIEGKHSYKDGKVGLISYDKKDFKSTVIMTGKDEYEITFEKQSRKAMTKERYWDYTTKTIHYTK